MKNVFIDANIWLSLYHFTNNDLDQFKKLEDLIGQSINIILPQQVIDEVYRNRESKIKDSLEKFQKLELQFPAFVKNYREYIVFQDEYKILKNKHNDWLNIIKRDIQNNTTPADIAIEKLFNKIDVIDSSGEIISKAITRINTGNPPGKNNSYGDAINWEILLQQCPNNEDLFLISEDKDYRSIFDNSIFSNFLEKEWKKQKNSSIVFFRSLTDFFKNYVVSINLENENEKNELIDSLENSINYSMTHTIIEKLTKYSEWSELQIETLCKIVLHNGQVGRILADIDVLEFYSKLLDKCISKSEVIENVCKLIKEYVEENDLLDVNNRSKK